MLGIVCTIKLMKETMTMASIPTQEEVLAATRKSQEAMMATIKAWLETVRTAAPKLPSRYAPLTDKLPKLSQVSLPFADKLPTPQDAVANAYHLAEQLLASQRKFAEELVKATAPLRPGYRESSPEVPSRSAWQDAVTDSEPKTPAVSAAPKAAPARPASATKAPRTTARKSTTGNSARKGATASSTGSARKNAGTTTPAPKGTDAR
jgi:hypothetical protein